MSSEAPGAARATKVTSHFGNHFPSRPLTAAPAKGRIGMSQSSPSMGERYPCSRFMRLTSMVRRWRKTAMKSASPTAASAAATAITKKTMIWPVC